MSTKILSLWDAADQPRSPAADSWKPQDVQSRWSAAANQDAFRRWCEEMSAGQFHRAWSLNDQEREHWPSAHQLWDGRDLRNTPVHLVARHGLGDFVQMMRFVPVLKRLACNVTLSVAPPLRSLVPYFIGACDLAGSTRNAPEQVLVELMELPYALRITLDELPHYSSYLRLPAQIINKAHSQMRTGSAHPKIGVVWSGGTWDCERWISPEYLDDLLRLPEHEWWSLQRNVEAASGREGSLRSTDEITSGTLVDLAAAMYNLDLVITVDTLAAHLAGAMGKEVWVLLKRDADWRWLRKRTDSPWYPSMRLFRQTKRNDWSTVTRELGVALKRRQSVPRDQLKEQGTIV